MTQTTPPKTTLLRATLLGTAAGLSLCAAASAQILPDRPAERQVETQRDQRRPSGQRGARDGSIRDRVLPDAGLVSTWSVGFDATYSDNYRRLPETIDRQFLVPGADGELTSLILGEEVDVALPVPGGDPLEVTLLAPVEPRDAVEIETPGNVIGTLTFEGGTVYDRPGVTGIVQGSLSVVGYGDTSTLDERLAEQLSGDVPDGFFDEFSDLSNATLFPGTTLFIPSSADPVDADALIPTLVPTSGRGEIENVFVQPNLRASATARVVPDLFYVDASAVAQQEALALRAEIQEEGAGRIASQVTLAGGSLSPYLFRELARGSTIEARYRLSTIQVLDESRRGTDPFDRAGRTGDADQRFTNDSVANEVLTEYRSGELLGRLGFAVRGQAARTDEDGSDVLNELELDRLSGSGEVNYALTRGVTVLAEAGYDDVGLTLTDPRAALAPSPDDPDAEPRTGDLVVNEDELSGFFWRVGFAAVPGRRTRAAVSVGERFGGTLVEADVSYEPTARLSFRLGASRQLATSAQDQLVGLGALNVQTLNVLNRLAAVQGTTAERLLEQVVSFSSGFDDIQRQQVGAGAFNRYSGGVNYNRPRTSFAASFTYAQNEFAQGFTDDTGQRRTVDSDNTNVSVNVGADHALSRRLSVQASARYLQNDGLFLGDLFLADEEGGAGPNGGETEQLFLSVGGAYQIGPRLSLTGRAYRLQRTGGTRLEFDENAVGAGVRFAF